jgi:hypothetical protein
MARIPPLEDPDADVLAILDGSDRLFGPGALSARNLYSYVPGVFKWFVPFNASLQLEGCGGRLDGRTKELAVLTTSITNACKY